MRRDSNGVETSCTPLDELRVTTQDAIVEEVGPPHHRRYVRMWTFRLPDGRVATVEHSRPFLYVQPDMHLRWEDDQLARERAEACEAILDAVLSSP